MQPAATDRTCNMLIVLLVYFVAVVKGNLWRFETMSKVLTCWSLFFCILCYYWVDAQDGILRLRFLLCEWFTWDEMYLIHSWGLKDAENLLRSTTKKGERKLRSSPLIKTLFLRLHRQYEEHLLADDTGQPLWGQHQRSHVEVGVLLHTGSRLGQPLWTLRDRSVQTA